MLRVLGVSLSELFPSYLVRKSVERNVNSGSCVFEDRGGMANSGGRPMFRTERQELSYAITQNLL